MAVASSAAIISPSLPSTSRRRIPISASSIVSPSLRSSFSAPTSLSLKNINRALQDPTRTLSSRRNQGNFSCSCLFGLLVSKPVVVGGVPALVFGPKKLPKVSRSVVKSSQQETNGKPEDASNEETVRSQKVEIPKDDPKSRRERMKMMNKNVDLDPEKQEALWEAALPAVTELARMLAKMK